MRAAITAKNNRRIFMIQKIKNWLESHQKEYELLRYLFAGGVTTLLSMLISYGVCFVLADRAELSGNLILWIIDSINRATPSQVSIANTVSWIIAVLFAFWINRGMVFRAEGGHLWRELWQFAAGRLVSFFLFEQGLALLLVKVGVPNVPNRIAILLFVVVFNYVISKFWIFKKA